MTNQKDKPVVEPTTKARAGVTGQNVRFGSFQSPKRAYSPEDLNQLEWLFDSVWAVFKTQYPTRDEVADEERKTTLRQTLFALACRGELGDEDELRALLLASVTVAREASQTGAKHS